MGAATECNIGATCLRKENVCVLFIGKEGMSAWLDKEGNLSMPCLFFPSLLI